MQDIALDFLLSLSTHFAKKNKKIKKKSKKKNPSILTYS